MVAKTAPVPRIALLDPELDMVEFGHPNFFRYVNRCLFQSGYIVLRNAVDRNRCSIFRRLIRRSHEELAAKLKRKGIVVGALAPKDKEKSTWHEVGLALQNGQVSHGAFGLVNPGLALDDVIADWKLYSLLQNFFGGAFGPAATCRTQWIDPARAEPVVRWRNDALHDGGALFGLTVWVPLEDCGIDAPGIQFAPGNHQAVQGFLKYDSSRPGAFDATGVARIEDGRYVRGLFGSAIAQPAFLAGDIAIFTNWAIHATHWTEAMAKPRQSIECRFVSERFNFPSCAF